jgi:8-oxo-dGTP pyrophosphatase MutT (NUDIX family)
MSSSKSKKSTKTSKIKSQKLKANANLSVETSESDSESYEDPFYIEFNSDVSDSDLSDEDVDVEEDNSKQVKVKSDFKVKVKSAKSARSALSARSMQSAKRSTKKSTKKSTENGLQSIISSTAKMSIGTKGKSGSKSKGKSLTNKRKTIFLNDNPTKPVTAAGVILYRFDGKKMQLLLINSRNKLEDIGGKIDQIDDSIEEAAAREVEEETNGMIKRDDIIDRLNATKSNELIYVKNSKYVIYVIKADDAERELTKDEFGDYEDHDKIERTIQWVARDTAFSTAFIRGRKLNFRMMSKALKDHLVSIEKNKKFTKSLFK